MATWNKRKVLQMMVILIIVKATSFSSVLYLGYVSSVSCTNSVDACSEVSQEEEVEGRLSSKFICGYRLGQSFNIPGFI